MQQDNKIEDKLRQMDNKQLPDLSHMDKHWQQMHAMLIVPVKIQQQSHHFTNINIKWLVPIAAIISIIILSYYFIGVRHSSKEKTNSVITISDKKTQQTPITKVVQPSLKNKSTSYIINPKEKIASIIIHQKEKIDTADNSSISFTDCSNCVIKSDSIKIADDKQDLLNAFVSQLEKKDQQFIINTNRDTVINCTEGTTIFIPADAFNTTGEIIFSVKEFYKYSDMVLNKLVTKSDGDQLISGGMFHLAAYKNGNEVSLNPNSPIKVYIPNISSKDSLGIFNGEDFSAASNTTDKETFNFVNWKLSTIRIDSPVYKMFIRAIDLRDESADIRYTKNGKTKAVFLRAKHSASTKEELEKLLEKKYKGYYDKIRVRKHWWYDKDDHEYGDLISNTTAVGDTALLLPGTIRFYKLQPIDTVYKFVYSFYKGSLKTKVPELTNNAISKIGEKYSIELNKLGWINCDRFWKNQERKINYAIDLKDTASHYYTMMVFNNYKSIMNGYYLNGTTVTFPNIPINEPVKIISFGIDKNGRSVSAIKEINTSSIDKTELEFEATSATAFKNSLSKIDK